VTTLERAAPRWLIALVFGVLTLIWGTTWAAIRVSLAAIPPFTGVVLRFALSGSLLLLAVPFLGLRLGRSRHERRLWLVNGLCTFGGSYGVVYWAEQWVPSGLASVLFATMPLFIALLAHLWLPEERLSAGRLAGILIGFAGVVLLFSEDFGRLASPEALGPAAIFLLSPLLSAIGAVTTRKWGREVSPLSLASVPSLVGAAALAPLARLCEREWEPRTVPAGPWLALLYLAFAGTALTFTLYYWLIRRTSAQFAGLVGYSVPVVAVAVGALWLGETVTLRVVAGGGLVLAGVAVALRGRIGSA